MILKPSVRFGHPPKSPLAPRCSAEPTSPRTKTSTWVTERTSHVPGLANASDAFGLRRRLGARRAGGLGKAGKKSGNEPPPGLEMKPFWRALLIINQETSEWMDVNGQCMCFGCYWQHVASSRWWFQQMNLSCWWLTRICQPAPVNHRTKNCFGSTVFT